MVCFVVTQHSESELSLCLRYSKTSCEATPNHPFNIRLNSDDPMILCEISDDSGRLQLYSHLLLELLGLLASNLSEVATR